eukprot:scaffold1440_cov332-Pavlova_lutheri.AAC.31
MRWLLRVKDILCTLQHSVGTIKPRLGVQSCGVPGEAMCKQYKNATAERSCFRFRAPKKRQGEERRIVPFTVRSREAIASATFPWSSMPDPGNHAVDPC